MECPKCKKKMIKYGTAKRQIKGPNKTTILIKVQRYRCCNCNMTIRELPSGVVPFKQYSKDIIDGVKDGSITSDILEFEDYPCEMTMKRWKNDT